MTDWPQDLTALSPERRTAMEFLRTHLPASDLDSYPFALFLQFADHALFLRENAPWCRALDEEIFLHYVLFPRVNDEDLSFHRQIFYDALRPRVCGLPSVEAVVLEVNRWCHETACYEWTDERTASPLTVYRSGSGRCGEESAFLVSALRSVGVPARQVYVPRWSHCDDNHAWVEALCGNAWRFLGACEPEPVLDRGWFNAVASRAVLVRSRLFGAGRSPLHGQPIGQDGIVTYYNQTARYAPAWSRVFRARTDGKPAAGAVFQLQILNEASFHTVAVLTADKNGEARAGLGLGTVHVLAVLGDRRGEGDCQGAEITLELVPAGGDDADWTDFDFHAASAAPVNFSPLDNPQRTFRADTRQKGDALRRERTAAFCRPDPDHPQWLDLLRAARGNVGEILAFLRGGNAPGRERLLCTLLPKDLRDTGWATLEDHFAHLPPRGNQPEDIYWNYIACPRIAGEKITPWRRALKSWLSGWTGSPALLWTYINELIVTEREGLGPNLFRPPELTVEAGRSDAHSKRILYVASLRALGIPARLRLLDGAPEYWENGAFRTVFPEESGTLRLICSTASGYRREWSLSRRARGGWRLMDLSEERWEGGRLIADLPAGCYRLITSVRLPGGDQLAARRDFTLQPGEDRTIPLRLREYALEDALFRQPMPPVSAATPDGAKVPDIFQLDGRPSLLLWLEEGAEPTEHLLLELANRRRELQALPLNVVFLVRGPDSLEQRTLNAVLSQWDGVRVLYDDWAFDLEDTARRLARDPDTPPLTVLCDGQGSAVYADSGYRVGVAEIILRTAGFLRL